VSSGIICKTVKSKTLQTVTPCTVTQILPEVAPAGTLVTMDVVLAASTAAAVPLKVRMLSSSSESKFSPVIFTVASTRPLGGLKLVICGVGITIKLVALVMVTPLTLIVILPVDAPTGTITVILVGVDPVTIAVTSLNFTIFSESVSLKLVPEIVTIAPAAPLKGIKSVIVGVGNTVKSDVLVTVIPFNVKEILPVVAPEGTVVIILVDVEPVTIDGVLLNCTTLFAGVALKFVPLIVTVALNAPLVGVKAVIVGVGNTVKFVVPVIVTPLTKIEIGPVIAPAGIVAVMLVDVDAITLAITPLKETVLFEGVVLKLVPEMVTVAPSAPLEGLKLVIVGAGNTVKFVVLVTVTPLLVNVILPVVAPAGTVVVMLVAEDTEIIAGVLLNLRM
jgi:hypothetical protein